MLLQPTRPVRWNSLYHEDSCEQPIQCSVALHGVNSPWALSIKLRMQRIRLHYQEYECNSPSKHMQPARTNQLLAASECRVGVTMLDSDC